MSRARTRVRWGMTTTATFDARNLTRLEALLLEHPIAQHYFQGILYDGQGRPLTELILDSGAGKPILLDGRMIGRLFMIPDGSLVSAVRVTEHQGTPAGIDIRYSNVFLAEDEQNSVIVYRSESGPALWVEALYIRSIMLAADAPPRLITVAFGFMAIAAYRLGFKFISLYGAGRGPLPRADADGLVGYAVWPRFGFDAEVLPVELDRFPDPALRHATTIQDVRKTSPGWWEGHGSGRTMAFDLTPNSRSWSILINYLYIALQEDAP